MKPELKDGWVHCLGMFIPDGMSDEEWNNLNVNEQDQQAEWRANRFKINLVAAYHRASYNKTVGLLMKNGHSMTIQAKLEDIDDLMDQYELWLNSK